MSDLPVDQPATTEQPKTDAERIAELTRRLAMLESYIEQLKRHGHLPNLRPIQ
jgi:hypothetical protein